MKSILIIAGENSGETYGAALVRSYKAIHPSTHFFGIGGDKMAQAGVDNHFSIKDISVTGIFEVLGKIKKILMIFKKIKQQTRIQKPEAAVLIDSPDFNLRLAKALKKMNIPVLYYVSPTIWAWRKGRLKTIKKNVSKMLLIFPFEQEIYDENQIPASFIGHPLLETVKTHLTKTTFFHKYGLERHKKLISLLPGSRRNEIDQHMPILMQTVAEARKTSPWQFVLIKAESIEHSDLDKHIPPEFKDIPILEKDRYEAMGFSDIVLTACGTATLEAALLDVPAVTFYRISPLTYYLGKPFVKVRVYSIVNILAGEMVIPELIQRDFNSECLLNETLKILSSEETKHMMSIQYMEIKKKLSEGNLKASTNAAKELDQLIL